MYMDRLKGDDCGMTMMVIIVAIKLKVEMLDNELRRIPIIIN